MPGEKDQQIDIPDQAVFMTLTSPLIDSTSS